MNELFPNQWRGWHPRALLLPSKNAAASFYSTVLGTVLLGPLTILGPGDKSSHISTICYFRTPPFSMVMLREGLALTSVWHTVSLLAVSNWLPFTWRPSVTIPALALSFLATKPPSWVCVTLIIIPALSFFSAACVHSSLSVTLRLSQQLTFPPFLRPSPLFSFVFMQRQFLVWRMSFLSQQQWH